MLDTLLISLHVPTGIVAAVAGLVAMLSRKGAWWHRRAGLTYLTALLTLAATAAGLVTTRGSQFAPLLAVGSTGAALAVAGYLSRNVRQDLHITGMGLSYVAMLTAFYVDNGPRLPLWNLLPPWSFWVLPAAVGLPLIVRALRRRGYRCVG